MRFGQGSTGGQAGALQVSAPGGFDFTCHMRSLCADLVRCLPDLQHIDLARVAISFARARKRGPCGMQASLTPLRFDGGSLVGVRQGRRVTLQRIFAPGGAEMLYVLTFYLPRYLDLALREKLETVLHELWHIGPRCDGDLRRYGGRCYAHSRSRAEYDAHIASLADRFLAMRSPAESCELLQFGFAELCRRHGRIRGAVIRRPKLIPLDA